MAAPMTQRVVTEAAWSAEGERLFGADRMTWRFVCPSCGHVASVQQWKDAGAPVGVAGFSCIGRWLPGIDEADRKTFRGAGGPCAYAGGGLIGLNPVRVECADGGSIDMFAFAEVA